MLSGEGEDLRLAVGFHNDTSRTCRGSGRIFARERFELPDQGRWRKGGDDRPREDEDSGRLSLSARPLLNGERRRQRGAYCDTTWHRSPIDCCGSTVSRCDEPSSRTPNTYRLAERRRPGNAATGARRLD